MGMTQRAFSEHLHDAMEHISNWDSKARDDYKMMGLNQWAMDDIVSLGGSDRPALTFDRLRPLIQAIGGSQSTNRFQSTFVAREYTLDDIDRYASKGAREWSRWVQQVGDWEHHESLAFFDCLICGIGVLEMYMAHDIDPDGRIRLRRRLPWEILWDPASAEPNMADAEFMISDKWLLEDELAGIFGQDAVGEVIDMAEAQTATPRREGFWRGLFTTKTTEQRHAYDLRRPGSWDDRYYDAKRRRVRLFEFLRVEREYRVRIIGPDVRDTEAVLAGMQENPDYQPTRLDTFETPDKARELMSELQEKVMGINMIATGGDTVGPLRDPVAIDDFPVKYHHRSWHTKASLLKDEQLPYNGFPYLFLNCHEDWSEENARHFFGLVRQGKDPQKASNKFLSQGVHLFNANPKGALLYEEGLFPDKTKAMEEWNKATGLIAVEQGKMQLPRPPFAHLQSTVSLTNIEKLLAHAQGSIAASMGLSEAVTLGAVSDVRRVSGEALTSMMESNIKTQSAPFDSLRLYRKLVGRLLLGFTDAYSDPEQIIRVVGEEDIAFVAAMLDGGLQEEYDVISEEAPTSVNEQSQMYKALFESGIMPQMAANGMPMPPEMANFFPGDPEAISELKLAFQKTYEVSILTLEVQKMTLMNQAMQLQQQQAMMQQGVAPPPEEAPPGQPPPTSEAPTQ